MYGYNLILSTVRKGNSLSVVIVRKNITTLQNAKFKNFTLIMFQFCPLASSGPRWRTVSVTSMTNTYCCEYSINKPDDGQQICSKKIEFFTKIKLKNNASLWLLL